ncbi:MAG TPA: hypothetical protein PLZ16_06430 [Gammaproteobacteria bacterium]|nr:hypothetical protein [Gammaproteobacteria bacterium]
MKYEVIAGACVLAALLAMLIGFSRAQRRWHIHPEITRKSVHVSMGLVTLAFPWIFERPAPVIVLAAITMPALILIRSVGSIKAHVGGALGSVEREGYGEIFFTLGVTLVFVLAREETLLYLIPVLILTFADTLAALVGHFGGRLFFTTAEGRKTLEGSLAFLIVAVLCIALPLHLFSQLSFDKVVMIALLLGLLIMLFEAISWAGIDNLLIPLFAFLLLRHYVHMTAADIGLHLALLSLLVSALVLWQRYSSLRDEAVLTAMLYGYFAWAVGGTRWLAIALIMMVSYPFLTPGRQQLGRRHGIQVTFHIAGSGALWLIAAQLWDTPALFYLYSLSFATHLALICVARHKAARPAKNTLWLGLGASVKAMLVVFVPYAWFSHTTDAALLTTAFMQIVAVLLLFVAARPDLANYERQIGAERWYWQSGMIFISCCLGYFPYGYLVEGV